jgi:hypothetical protein
VNLSSHLLERFMRLGPPVTRDLAIRRDLRVPMPDGVVLLADLWAPRASAASLPTALLRSPYGRRGLISTGMARPLAERGFQVLIQSTRGTFGSGGVFDPMRQEREDGLATLDWVIKQAWFDGSIVLTGPSYLGYVQWAVADRLPPEVKAMIPQVTDSALTLEFLRPDGLSLETPFAWGVMVAGQERRGAMLRGLAQGRRDHRALEALPLSQADVAAAGQRVGYVQDILACDAADPRPRPPLRHGRGSLAGLRPLAAAWLLTPALPPPVRRGPGQDAARTRRAAAQPVPLRPGRSDPRGRRRAHDQNGQRPRR